MTTRLCVNPRDGPCQLPRGATVVATETRPVGDVKTSRIDPRAVDRRHDRLFPQFPTSLRADLPVAYGPGIAGAFEQTLGEKVLAVLARPLQDIGYRCAMPGDDRKSRGQPAVRRSQALAPNGTGNIYALLLEHGSQ